MLAAYLQFPDIDVTKIYMLLGAIVAVMAAMAVFRNLAKVKESRQVQRSSWRTFEKVARVRGLNAAEARALSEVVRRCRVKRPTQVLGSIQLYDRCMDRALERGYVGDHDQALLEAARTKLVSTASKGWDGHTDRRQFERLAVSFRLGVHLVTKEGLDEELRTTYQEGDEQFGRGMAAIVAQGHPLDAETANLSAGGLAVFLPDTVEPRNGDYASVVVTDPEGTPINIDGLACRILAQEEHEEEKRNLLHLTFLPYPHELKRQIIHLVHGGGPPPPLPAESEPGEGASAAADSAEAEDGAASSGSAGATADDVPPRQRRNRARPARPLSGRSSTDPT